MKNETRFLVTGDLHWTGRNPLARTDNYKEALVFKLREIFNLAHERQVAGIIIPGDIFDTPGISISILAQLMTLLSWTRVPILTIAGNHDLYGGNPASEDRTPYGILVRSGLIIDMNNDIEVVGPLETNIRGRSWDSNTTDKDICYYLMPYPQEHVHSPDILITHGMLLEKSPNYELRHTLLRDVAEHPNAPHVLINGHFHDGFGVKKINNTLFINPGSIGRIKATEENLNRIPQVALLTIPEDAEPYAELIPLKSARPGHEVLSREHIEEARKKKAMTEEFLGLLAEEGESRFMDLEEIVQDIARRKELPRQVVVEAVRRLTEAREEVDHERRAG